jgi:predicted NUDIX family phosphoesterase
MLDSAGESIEKTEMTKSEEMVLVVRRALLEELGMFQGLCFDVARYLPALLSRTNNFFMPRSAAESDPSFKQIIPYVLLVHEGKLLHYVRGKRAGEQRLAAKGSIGIGGHMNDADEGLFALDEEAYRVGVRREVNEELRVPPAVREEIVALLNDDSTEVGQVHLGVVHVYHLGSADVQKREAMITELEFLTPAQLAQKRAAMETWSQICLDALEQLTGSPAQTS